MSYPGKESYIKPSGEVPNKKSIGWIIALIVVGVIIVAVIVAGLIVRRRNLKNNLNANGQA